MNFLFVINLYIQNVLEIKYYFYNYNCIKYNNNLGSIPGRTKFYFKFQCLILYCIYQNIIKLWLPLKKKWPMRLNNKLENKGREGMAAATINNKITYKTI